MIKLDVPEKAEYYFKGKYDTSIYVFPSGIYIHSLKHALYSLSENTVSKYSRPQHRMSEHAFIPSDKISVVNRWEEDAECLEDLEVDKHGYFIYLIEALCAYLSDPINETDEPETFDLVTNDGEIKEKDLYLRDIIDRIRSKIDYTHSEKSQWELESVESIEYEGK